MDSTKMNKCWGANPSKIGIDILQGEKERKGDEKSQQSHVITF